MKPALCLSFRFIQPYPLFHGRTDGGESEWPPSPLRAFQALLNAACLRTRGQTLPSAVRSALEALEQIRPAIIAPHATLSVTGHRAYVPHNHADLVSAAWNRGDETASIATHRMEKDFHPQRIATAGEELPVVHYLYSFDSSSVDPLDLHDALLPSVRSIHCLGWGIDQVVADATLLELGQQETTGEKWTVSPLGGKRLRVPRAGSLDALLSRHDRFLQRLSENNWTPVPPLSAFDQISYRRASDPVPRPTALFKLVDDNDDTVTYPQTKLIHIAGMIRHLAIELMKLNPPRNLRETSVVDWVRAYVAGHQSAEEKAAGAPHSQFSYVPLQSIGMTHTDPSVRRVMIVAPLGDHDWLEHLATQLDGRSLQPLPNTKLPCETRLERIRGDGVCGQYLKSSHTWASVTPVILPGHDDHKPNKTRSLIRKALQQSGIDQPCEFEWSPFSQFRKILSAHKYRRDPNDPDKKIDLNYIRPDHLLHNTAVHLTIRFGRREDSNNENSPWLPANPPIPGPLTIGAGRHCGFGLMSSIELG